VGVSTEAVHMSDLSNIVIANLKWQKSRSEPTSRKIYTDNLKDACLSAVL